MKAPIKDNLMGKLMKIYLTLDFIYQVNINNFVLIYILFYVREEGEKRRNRGDGELIFFYGHQIDISFGIFVFSLEFAFLICNF